MNSPQTNSPDCPNDELTLATKKVSENSEIGDSNLEIASRDIETPLPMRSVSEPLADTPSVPDVRASSVPVAVTCEIVDPAVEVIVEPDLVGGSTSTLPGSLTDGQKDFLYETFGNSPPLPSPVPRESVFTPPGVVSHLDEVRSTKRKAEVRASPPSGGGLAVSPIRSDEEDAVLTVKSLRRRRIFNSDEDTPGPSRRNDSHERDMHSVPLVERILSVDDLVADNSKALRSGKRLINESLEIACVSDEELDLANTSVASIGGRLIEYLTEIDNLRIKSKKLQGPISGRIKQLIKLSKDAAASISSRSSAHADVSYLRMRNKELLLNNKALEQEVKRLSDENYSLNNQFEAMMAMNRRVSPASLSARGSIDGENAPIPSTSSFNFPSTSFPPLPCNVNPKSKSTAASKSVSTSNFKSKSKSISIPPSSLPSIRHASSSTTVASPLPLPSSPAAVVSDEQLSSVYNFASYVDRFLELKTNMLQEIENMSATVNEFMSTSKMTENLPRIDVSSKLEPTSKIMKKSKVKDKKLRIVAEEKLPSNVISRYRHLLRNKSLVQDDSVCDLPVETKLKPESGNDFNVSCGDISETFVDEREQQERDVPATTPTETFIPVIRRRKRLVSNSTPSKKPPTSAAVLVSGKEKDFSYADALKLARERISLRELGIETTRIKTAYNGALLIEIPGEADTNKADELIKKLNEVIVGAKISRPIKKADVRIFNFDKSVSAEEIKYAVAEKCNLSLESIKISGLRIMRNGLQTAWITLPLAAAIKLVEKPEMPIGWTIARLDLAASRPTQCFKCWAFGHMIHNCTRDINRMNNCFRCSKPGHKASECLASFCCAVCKENNIEFAHRLGGRMCHSAFPSDRFNMTFAQTRDKIGNG